MEEHGLTALQRVTLIKMYNDITHLQHEIEKMHTTITKITEVLQEFTETTDDLKQSVSAMKKLAKDEM